LEVVKVLSLLLVVALLLMASEGDSEGNPVILLVSECEGLKSILRSPETTENKGLSVGFDTVVGVIEKDNNTNTTDLTEEDPTKPRLLSRAAKRRRKAQLEYQKSTLPKPLPQQLIRELSSSGSERSPPILSFKRTHRSQSENNASEKEEFNKTGILLKNGTERDVVLNNHTLSYSNKSKNGRKTLSLIGEISVLHILPVTINITFTNGKVVSFKTESSFDTIDWTNAISMQIKRKINSEPVLGDWLDDYSGASPQEMIVIENPDGKKKRKKDKKKRIKKSSERTRIGSLERFEEEIFDYSCDSVIPVETITPVDKKSSRTQKKDVKDSPRHKRRRKKRSGSQEVSANSAIANRSSKKTLRRSQSADEDNHVFRAKKRPDSIDFSPLCDTEDKYEVKSSSPTERRELRFKSRRKERCSDDSYMKINKARKKKRMLYDTLQPPENQRHSLPAKTKSKNAQNFVEEICAQSDVIREEIPISNIQTKKIFSLRSSDPASLATLRREKENHPKDLEKEKESTSPANSIDDSPLECKIVTRKKTKKKKEKSRKEESKEIKRKKRNSTLS